MLLWISTVSAIVLVLVHDAESNCRKYVAMTWDTKVTMCYLMHLEYYWTPHPILRVKFVDCRNVVFKTLDLTKKEACTTHRIPMVAPLIRVVFERKRDVLAFVLRSMTVRIKQQVFNMNCDRCVKLYGRYKTLHVASYSCRGRTYWGRTCEQRCFCLSGRCATDTGTCIETYTCHPRYVISPGSHTCNLTCASGRFKYPGCRGICHCKDNGECNINDGRCPNGCMRGYTGPNCQTRCIYGMTEQCTYLCNCANRAVCNKTTGRCPSGQCSDRYYGRDCQGYCPKHTYLSSPDLGSDIAAESLAESLKNDNSYLKKICTNNCHCLNMKRCSVKTGVCSRGGCMSGYKGQKCQEQCTGDKFGRNCLKTCHCKVGATCSPTSGACSTGCHHRWSGIDCQKSCPSGTYLVGGSCSGVCHCVKKEECVLESGGCRQGGCLSGWIGPICQKKCSKGRFGVSCNSRCHCDGDAPCRHTDGWCEMGCDLRYTGNNCSLTCPNGMWNVTNGCQDRCVCKHDKYCRVKDSVCTQGGCETEYLGKCILGCPVGFYDAAKSNCTRRCHCEYDASCDPRDGKCPADCSIRFTGESCHMSCPRGKYGIYAKSAAKSNCNETCTCRKSSECRVADGRCSGPCNPGYIGFKCNMKCAVGTFGDKCLQRCRCRNDRKCHHVNGWCQDGLCAGRYFGRNCTKKCPSSRFQIDGTCGGQCRCLDQRQCNVTDGTCGTKGCRYGYTGKTCQKECVNTFGKQCLKKCHCKTKVRCDSRNGYCPDGCHIRYTGEGCQATCVAGRYGPPGCANTCACRNPHACDIVTGECKDGKCRSARMSPPMCKKGCRLGVYRIKGACTGKCKCHVPKECQVDTGVCRSGGCKIGWMGKHCLKKCPFYKFGVNCARTCHCKFGLVCTPDYGECSHGCEDGFSGVNCQLKTDMRKFTGKIGILAGVIALVIFLALLIGFLARRSVRRRKREMQDRISEIMLSQGGSKLSNVYGQDRSNATSAGASMASLSGLAPKHGDSMASVSPSGSEFMQKSSKLLTTDASKASLSGHPQSLSPSKSKSTHKSSKLLSADASKASLPGHPPSSSPSGQRSRSRQKSSEMHRRDRKRSNASLAADSMASLGSVSGVHDDSMTSLSPKRPRSRQKSKEHRRKRSKASLADGSATSLNQ